MLLRSQPVDSKIAAKLSKNSSEENKLRSKEKIVSQHIGTMFGDLHRAVKRHPDFRQRIRMIWFRLKSGCFDFKHTIGNHRRWHKTMKNIRPNEGFYGLLVVMQTHLRQYVDHEIKYGYAEKTYKQQKINSAQKTIWLLERMKEPDEYLNRQRKAIEAKYPKYMNLITKYDSGSTSISGDFVSQGKGWAGIESGKDPREGYFELKEGRFELSESPDQQETDRLIRELRNYYRELKNSYIAAKNDSKRDFENLSQLLQENLYSWWD